MRDSFLKRDSAKKITLALGQNSSFSRGFDKILQVLLVGEIACCLNYFDLQVFISISLYSQASLRENSSGIRAKALRAVCHEFISSFSFLLF